MTIYKIPSTNAFGFIYNHNTSTTVTITTQNTPTKISSGFTAGEIFRTKFQNNSEIKLNQGGYYDLIWQISFILAAGAAQEIEGDIMINGVATGKISAHRFISTATDTGSMGAPGKLKLNVDDVISLSVENKSSTNNIIIEHAELSIERIK